MAEYKIKDLEALTGIKAHTIRIWEKRYNLISPERTDTLIRTYTDEDLTNLLSVALLNKNGIKISKIVDMGKEQISKKVWDLKFSKNENSSQEKLILALIELDEDLFRNTLQSLIDSVGLEETFASHLIPFLDRIGIMWIVGTIHPAQEHFISNLIRQKVISEIDKLSVPNNDIKPVMLYLPEHEWHEISLLYYQYILRRNGINTVYLGQSLPYDSLLLTIEKLAPRALVTSWLTAVDEKYMINYFKQLSNDIDGIEIYAGGYQVNKCFDLISEWALEIKEAKNLAEIIESIK
ncbi:MAG: MerR family transcriptional regulator [Flavobacteriia bacterium]